MRGTRHTLPAGRLYFLTVDRKTLAENQKALREHRTDYDEHQKPPCWIQIEDDKQNKINCWHIIIRGTSEMIYGEPHICGAMVYVQTEAELEYWA